MFTKKFNNLSDSLIEAASKTLTQPIVKEASNEKPTINHLELSEEELAEANPKLMPPRPRPGDTTLVTPMKSPLAPRASHRNIPSRLKDSGQPRFDNFAAADAQAKEMRNKEFEYAKMRAMGLDPESLPRNYRAEELVGNQHKIDANKNGKIDADDFKKLRNEQPQLSPQDREELRRGRDPFRGDTTTGLRPSRPAPAPRPAPKPTTVAPMPAPPAPPVAPKPAPPAPPVAKSGDPVANAVRSTQEPKPQIQLPMAPASQYGQTKVTPTHLYNPETKETKSISESMRSHLRELLKINEAKRGRKPKDGGDDEEGTHYDEREDPETGEVTLVKDTVPPKKHIMNQLRQAAQSMKAQHPVSYADGSTHNVPKHVAKDLVNAYQDPSKKPYEREAMQAKIGQSHKALMQHHSTMSEESFDPNLKNGKKMLLEPGKAKKEKKELDENPIETVNQIKMYQQDEEQVTHDAPYAKRVVVPEESEEEPPFEPDPKRKKRPNEPTTAGGLARAAMRQAIERAKTKAKMNEEQIDEMKSREDTAHSEPSKDQPNIRGHKQAIEYWVDRKRQAKTENETVSYTHLTLPTKA